jgi:hypothetical protein
MAAPSLPSVFALCWCHSMHGLIGAKNRTPGSPYETLSAHWRTPSLWTW